MIQVAIWLLVDAMVLPVLLYIPFVQNVVKGIAVEQVSKTTGWDVKVDRILLQFPLNLSIDGVMVRENNQDTIIAARNIVADVKLLPLLRKDIDVRNATLSDGVYRLMSEDSSMLINAKVALCRIKGADINLGKNAISLNEAYLRGGNVNIYFDNEKSKPSPKDTANTEGWHITAHRIRLDRVHYGMQMLPTIADLQAGIGSAVLEDGMVDTKMKEVYVRYLGIDSVAGEYYTPSYKYMAEHPLPPDTIAEAVDKEARWTIRGDSVRLTRSQGVYAVQGVKAKRGLDMDYISAKNVNVAVDNFYNRGMSVTVPLKHFSADERCGVRIRNAKGTFAMDSLGMGIKDFEVNTVISQIKASAHIDNGVFEDNPLAKFMVKMDAKVGIAEVRKLYPLYAPILNGVPEYRPLTAKIDAYGTMRHVKIRKCNIDMQRYAHVSVNGSVDYPMNMKRISGNVNIDGTFDNINFIKPTLMSASMQKEVAFPPLTLKGNMNFKGSDVIGEAQMRLKSGALVLDAKWNGVTDSYALEFEANALPVHALLPLSPVSELTASGNVEGHGFDIYKTTTSIMANLELKEIEYDDDTYRDVVANASLNDGKFDVQMISSNPNCNLTLDANGVLEKNHYVFDIDADLYDLNLKELKLSKTESEGKGHVKAYGDIDFARNIYEAAVNLDNFRWTMDKDVYSAGKVDLNVVSDSTNLAVSFNNDDMKMLLTSDCDAKSLADRLRKSSDILMYQINNKRIDVDTLQNSLPAFSLELVAGRKNLLQQYMQNSDVRFNKINCEITNDSTIYLKGLVSKLQIGGLVLDTLTAEANEVKRNIAYNVHLGNQKGNSSGVASVNLSGEVEENTLTALLEQRDFKDKVGNRLGVVAMLDDTLVNVRLFPRNPIIGYKQWEVNDSNEITYNYLRHHFDADLRLRCDSSYVSLISDHETLESQEDVQMKISNVQVADWLSMSPFAPPLKGVLSSEMLIKYDGKNIWGDGSVNLDNVYFAKKKVGNVKLNTLIDLNPVDGGTSATGNVEINGRQCIVAFGSINDSTAKESISLSLELDRLPLSVVNPFMPSNVVEMSGYLDGLMSVTGSMKEPLMMGYVQCDSVTVNLPMFGSQMKLPDTKLPVDSSVIKFRNYEVASSNGNPLTIKGDIDMTSFDNPLIRLDLTGSNLQFVNSKQSRRSEVFGRGFANVNATVRGRMNNLDVDANISLLSGSNITYVMQTDVGTMASQQQNVDMVKFVQFNDSTSYENEERVATVNENSMNINAILNVQSGTTLNVYMSKDGEDKAVVQGNGILNYTQNKLGDMAMSGRYTVDNGYVRYSPPLISTKLFNLNSGSYIQWTGDIMDPKLSLSAVETLKTNVVQEGQDSRLVNFDILLTVSKSLSNMGVAFDLSTNDDMTVQNELQSMSSSQRENQAINLLLYDTYTGPGTTASSKLTGNPIYSFLQSKLNSWAASTIKGVDLSFGIDQYDQTKDGVTSTAMRYSYQVSKSLFNDRFKIVVGGNYSPDVTAEEEIARNLFNDVSLEYMLTKNGGMYVRLFNHTGFESVLEGQVTQTGVGFVLKRKLSNLRHIFRFGRRKKKAVVTDSASNRDETIPVRNSKKDND